MFIAWIFVSIMLVNCVDSLQERIIGGKRASEGQFPFMVRVSVNQAISDTEYVEIVWINGALLSEKWVLTIRSGIDTAEMVTVHLGAVNVDDKANAQEVAVKRKILRDSGKEFIKSVALLELYDYDTKKGNIGYLKLSGAEFRGRKECTALGFGLTTPQFDPMNINRQLWYTSATVKDECPCIRSDTNGKGLCTELSRSGPCNLDYGAPLICNGCGVAVLYGFTTKSCRPASKPCADMNTIAFYAPVGPVLDWIKQYVQPEMCVDPDPPKKESESQPDDKHKNQPDDKHKNQPDNQHRNKTIMGTGNPIKPIFPMLVFFTVLQTVINFY